MNFCSEPLHQSAGAAARAFRAWGRRLLVGLLPVLALCSPAAQGAPKPAEPIDPRLLTLIPPAPEIHPKLKGDDRLAKSVSTAMGDVPMADLLAELSKLSGIRLTAAPDTADDQVIAAFRERPLGKLLTLLAVHFGFTWRKKGDGYELWQDLASKQREEALHKEQRRLVLEQAFRIARMSTLSPEVREGRLKEIHDLLQQPGLDAAAARRLRAENWDLHRAGDTQTGVSTRLLALTSASRLQAFLSSGAMRLDSRTGEIDQATLQRLLAKNPAARFEFSSQASGPDGKMRQPPFAVIDSRFSDLDQPASQAGTIAVTIQAGASGSMMGRFTLGSIDDAEGIPPLLEDPRLDAKLPRTAPSFRHPAGFRTGPHAANWNGMLMRWSDNRLSLTDLLMAIHRQTGVDLLSDSFSPWRYPSPVVPAMEASARELLGRVALPMRLALRMEDQTLRIRSARYPILRPIQPPSRLIRQAMERLQPDQQAYLKLICDLGHAMTNVQFSEMLASWGYLSSNPRIFAPVMESGYSRLSPGRPALVDLSPRLRNRLIAGEELRIERLSRAERAEVEQLAVRAAREEARIVISGQNRAAGRPPAVLVLKTDTRVMQEYATYSEDGTLRMSYRRDVKTAVEHLPADEGREPVRIGSAFPQTSYSLVLQDAAGNPVRHLGTIQLTEPALLPQAPPAR